MPQNWYTRNINGVVEYLDGVPGEVGYRTDHAGSNHHGHIAFESEKHALTARAALEKAGIRVTEFGVTDGHSPNSYHYQRRAFDVPGGQFGKGTDAEVFAGSRRARQIVAATLGRRDGQPAGAPILPGASPPSAISAPPVASTAAGGSTAAPAGAMEPDLAASLQQQEDLRRMLTGNVAITLNRPGPAAMRVPTAIEILGSF